ncbi:MAG TPA: lysylphosphatidylglycerol synthase transmembrane domain-containing protein, partial [Anaerolineales bacterium]
MKRWQFWLGLAISAVFLALVLRGLDLAAFWVEVRQANYWWLLPGVGVYFIGVVVRAWRWQFLLRPLKRVPLASSWRLTAIGYMGNNIYPARAGELLRAALLKRNEGVAISASLATIIVERIFDGVVMLGFIFLNLGELARLTGGAGIAGGLSIQQIALWGTLIFIGALAIFLLGAMFPTQSEGLLALAGRVLPEAMRERFMSLARTFLEGLASLRSPVEALMVFATS